MDIRFVGLAMNVGISRHFVLTPNSSRRFPFLSNGLQQLLHFSWRSYGNPDESRTHVLGALAQKNPLLLKLSKELRSLRPTIGQQKISGAGEGAHAELLQFGGQDRKSVV